MLYSVRGKLINTTANSAVVECSGVGFLCQTTLNTLKRIKIGDEVMLYTYLSVREDAMELFGFATKTELDTFKTLIGVSGVGPKVGLALLSELSAEQIAMAIATDDVKTVTRAPGVGKKLAQRIILELKDKLAKQLGKGDDSFAVVSQGAAAAASGNIPKAVEALGVLGYTPADVSPVLAGFDSSLPVEQLIAMTLRELGRK